MPGFLGNVFLAALKCLTYFISSKTFCKYLLVRIHLKYCLERDSQTSPELTVFVPWFPGEGNPER